MKKIDDDASKGRAQLAQRMRAIISYSTSKLERGASTPPSLDLSNLNESKEATISDPLLSSELDSSGTLPGSVPLPGAGLSEPSESKESASSDPLLSSELTGSDPLLSSELKGSDSLLSSELTGSDPLLSSDTLPDVIGKNTDSDALLGSDVLLDKTLLSSDALLDKTLLSSDALPERSNNIFGELISEDLFFPVLNAGVYNLLSTDNASASMLFYWAFTTQRRSILSITYSQVFRELHYARTRTARTIDRIRESELFSVKTTPRGVFINLKKLLDVAQKTYPHSDQTDQTDSSDPLLPSSSSSYLKDLNTTTTEAHISSASLLIWKNIDRVEIQIIADLISFHGYTTNEITPKLLELMADRFRNSGMESIAYNLAYASANNKKVGSPVGYLLKTLTEDYGSSSLPLEAREKSDKLVETLRIVRTKKLDDYGASEMRCFLIYLGKHIPEGSSRAECEKKLADQLALSDNLLEKIKNLTNRNDEQNIFNSNKNFIKFK